MLFGGREVGGGSGGGECKSFSLKSQVSHERVWPGVGGARAHRPPPVPPPVTTPLLIRSYVYKRCRYVNWRLIRHKTFANLQFD